MATTQRALTMATKYLTVNQFVLINEFVTLGGLRDLIFKEHQNGLAKAGAIVRLGRKVLIDEAAFYAWIESKKVAA